MIDTDTRQARVFRIECRQCMKCRYIPETAVRFLFHAAMDRMAAAALVQYSGPECTLLDVERWFQIKSACRCGGQSRELDM